MAKTEHTKSGHRRKMREQAKRGFIMQSDKPAVEHIRKEERPHVAQEVRHSPGGRDGDGASAAEEFVRDLLPWAQASALGLAPAKRQHEPGPRNRPRIALQEAA